MSWFKRKKVENTSKDTVVHQSSIEVLQYKSKATKSVNQTKRDLATLKALLDADGITLRIHIATRMK